MNMKRTELTPATEAPKSSNQLRLMSRIVEMELELERLRKMHNHVVEVDTMVALAKKRSEGNKDKIQKTTITIRPPVCPKCSPESPA